jgi:hypothetical protein
MDDDLDNIADEKRREDPAVRAAEAPTERFWERDVEARSS